MVFKRKDEKTVQCSEVHDVDHSDQRDPMNPPRHRVLTCISSHSHRSENRRAIKLSQQLKRSKLLSMAQPAQPQGAPQSLFYHLETDMIGVRRVRGYQDIGVRSELSSRKTPFVQRAPLPASRRRQHHTRFSCPCTRCGSESCSHISDVPIIATTIDLTSSSGRATETGKSMDLTDIQ